MSISRIAKDMLRNVQVISTRREDGYDRENYTLALQMHPSGRYLLAGNRGHNSIVVYEVDKETGLLDVERTYNVGR